MYTLSRPTKAITIFKIIHNLIDIADTYLNNYLPCAGNSMKFQHQPHGLPFFPPPYRSVYVPDDVILSTTLNQFKCKLQHQFNFTPNCLSELHTSCEVLHSKGSPTGQYNISMLIALKVTVNFSAISSPYCNALITTEC